MPLFVKNLEYFKSIRLPDNPEFGTKLAEMITQISQGVNTIEAQTNSNATGQPQTPPAINSLNVTASNGHFQVAINHQGAQFYRDIHYWVEHSASPNFTDPHTVSLGAARNANLFLGNSTRYFRAFASYGSSPPGPMAYHGSASQPLAVTGGGSVPGPSFLASEGSGTGNPGVGHQGPGQTAYRTTTGAPPTR